MGQNHKQEVILSPSFGFSFFGFASHSPQINHSTHAKLKKDKLGS